jgi:hypothetical protein
MWREKQNKEKKNKMLSRIFGAKGEVIGWWRKLHNEELLCVLSTTCGMYRECTSWTDPCFHLLALFVHCTYILSTHLFPVLFDALPTYALAILHLDLYVTVICWIQVREDYRINCVLMWWCPYSGFCSVGKACRCTGGVGFAWGFQGCWIGHEFRWILTYLLGFPNKVLIDLMHGLLYTASG